jgi:hypothetical protein
MTRTKNLFILLITLLSAAQVYSQQRYFAEKAVVSFFSDAVVEDISATNEKVTSILDVVSGDVAYLMSIKDFQFPNKLMQVHFNEKYLESEKYPKSSFKGKITDFKINGTGAQNVKANGKLTIHGVTRDVAVTGTATVNGNRIIVKAKFKVKLLDYDIKVPQIVWQNIAQEVEVTTDFEYRPL